MKHFKRYSLLLVIAIMLTTVLTGCKNKNYSCPFSELTWDSTVDDMTKLEGTDYETYDSVYEGTTYTYPKEYNGKTGTIKYMYDDKEKLACIAWVYNGNEATDMDDVYNTIHQEVIDNLGETEYDSSNFTNHGSVWYRETGNVILTAMTTNDQNVMQFAFLSPDVSTKEADVKNKPAAE